MNIFGYNLNVSYLNYLLFIITIILTIVLHKRIPTTGSVMLIIASLLFLVSGVVNGLDFTYSNELSIATLIFATFLVYMSANLTKGLGLYWGLLTGVFLVSASLSVYKGYLYVVSSENGKEISSVSSISVSQPQLVIKPVEEKIISEKIPEKIISSPIIKAFEEPVENNEYKQVTPTENLQAIKGNRAIAVPPEPSQSFTYGGEQTMRKMSRESRPRFAPKYLSENIDVDVSEEIENYRPVSF